MAMNSKLINFFLLYSLCILVLNINLFKKTQHYIKINKNIFNALSDEHEEIYVHNYPDLFKKIKGITFIFYGEPALKTHRILTAPNTLRMLDIQMEKNDNYQHILKKEDLFKIYNLHYVKFWLSNYLNVFVFSDLDDIPNKMYVMNSNDSSSKEYKTTFFLSEKAYKILKK